MKRDEERMGRSKKDEARSKEDERFIKWTKVKRRRGTSGPAKK